jgi:threonine dehydrogenase-like Zn-dependent dehydrogenase
MLASKRLRSAWRVVADYGVLTDTDGGVQDVLNYTGGGADIVMHFVGEEGTPEKGLRMLRNGGTYNDLAELIELAHRDKVRSPARPSR